MFGTLDFPWTGTPVPFFLEWAGLAGYQRHRRLKTLSLLGMTFNYGHGPPADRIISSPSPLLYGKETTHLEDPAWWYLPASPSRGL